MDDSQQDAIPQDTRPTRHQYHWMPRSYKLAHTKPLKPDGTPFTAADLPALKAARLARLSKVTPVKGKGMVVNGKNVVTQRSFSIRAAGVIARKS